ncbi:hypothetical protein [Sphingomonas sp. PAMC 26621]|uniref:hypothetical protein n=1 Tax=Sphingomonas sp. PAMC 26621 TaxID=1112213 RepID=UPI0011110264|nr:hypothetical protein [Sphingomonas sp. PAMC 26621]
MVDARSGWLYGLDRAFSRAERGELLVEVGDRRQLLALGRTAPKPKGPHLDAKRLPFSVLMKLIQTHQDPLVIERLRLERARREAIGETP